MKRTPTFTEFWQAYPLHKGKKPAERAWNRLTAREKRSALAALPAYSSECQQRGIAYKYPQGWLNDHRWEDESEDDASQVQNASLVQKVQTPAMQAGSNEPAAMVQKTEKMEEW